jgi:S1-C subfamily serine protease
MTDLMGDMKGDMMGMTGMAAPTGMTGPAGTMAMRGGVGAQEGARRPPCRPVRGLLGLALVVSAGASGFSEVGIAAPALGPDTIADLVAKAAPAVVNLDTVKRRSNPMRDLDPFFHGFLAPDRRGMPRYFEQKGVGSGFVIDPKGLIVTNHHVTRDVAEITVTFPDGRSFQGKVIGQDAGTDLALVKVEAEGLPTLRFADPRAVRVGEWVVAIGSPLGLSTTVTAGIVSALKRSVAISERVEFLQTDAPINPGNSGGPLLNLNGEVVGINTAIAAKAQGIGFAIPVETARFVVSELREKGKVERPWMGLFIEVGASGLRVSEVSPDGPAFRAGVRAGDLILELEGKKVSAAADLSRALGDRRVGDRVRLALSRQGRRQQLILILGVMPPELQAPRSEASGRPDAAPEDE